MPLFAISIAHLYIPCILLYSCPFAIMRLSATHLNANSIHLWIIGLSSNRYLHICIKMPVKMLHLFPTSSSVVSQHEIDFHFKTRSPYQRQLVFPREFPFSSHWPFIQYAKFFFWAASNPPCHLPIHLVPLLWGHFILWSISSIFLCSCCIIWTLT